MFDTNGLCSHLYLPLPHPRQTHYLLVLYLPGWVLLLSLCCLTSPLIFLHWSTIRPVLSSPLPDLSILTPSSSLHTHSWDDLIPSHDLKSHPVLITLRYIKFYAFFFHWTKGKYIQLSTNSYSPRVWLIGISQLICMDYWVPQSQVCSSLRLSLSSFDSSGQKPWATSRHPSSSHTPHPVHQNPISSHPSVISHMYDFHIPVTDWYHYSLHPCKSPFKTQDRSVTSQQ